MAISHKSSLVSAVVFDSMHQVNSDLLITIGYGCLGCDSQVLERTVLKQLFHFQFGAVLPLGISILLVQEHCMLVVSWDFETKHVFGC